MRIRPFQAIYPNFDIIASIDSFFKTVKYDYRQYEESGFFQKASDDAVYIYQIQTRIGKHRGIVATVDIEDYTEGNILKHEDTLSTKEQSMMNLLLERKAMIKPVLLSYPGKESINTVIEDTINNNPLYRIRFENNGDVHQVWKITNGQTISKLQKAFKTVKKTYIADGHHRCSTSARLHSNAHVTHPNLNFSQLLSVFFSFDQLIIHDYNRVIEILNEITPTALIAEISKYCDIKRKVKPFRPKRKHELSLFINREWYKLKWKKKVLNKYNKEGIVLDSSLVNDLIMTRIMKIEDVRSDKRITYIEGTKKADGIRDACIKNENRIGLGLYPVSIAEFQELSDNGIMLPPKSTWFEPRIKNGMISQDFQ